MEDLVVECNTGGFCKEHLVVECNTGGAGGGPAHSRRWKQDIRHLLTVRRR